MPYLNLKSITNNPNNLDDETYILRLLKQVITVSLKTVAIVQNLPPLRDHRTITALAGASMIWGQIHGLARRQR